MRNGGKIEVNERHNTVVWVKLSLIYSVPRQSDSGDGMSSTRRVDVPFYAGCVTPLTTYEMISAHISVTRTSSISTRASEG